MKKALLLLALTAFFCKGCICDDMLHTAEEDNSDPVPYKMKYFPEKFTAVMPVSLRYEKIKNYSDYLIIKADMIGGNDKAMGALIVRDCFDRIRRSLPRAAVNYVFLDSTWYSAENNLRMAGGEMVENLDYLVAPDILRTFFDDDKALKTAELCWDKDYYRVMGIEDTNDLDPRKYDFPLINKRYWLGEFHAAKYPANNSTGYDKRAMHVTAEYGKQITTTVYWSDDKKRTKVVHSQQGYDTVNNKTDRVNWNRTFIYNSDTQVSTIFGQDNYGGDIYDFSVRIQEDASSSENKIVFSANISGQGWKVYAEGKADNNGGYIESVYYWNEIDAGASVAAVSAIEAGGKYHLIRSNVAADQLDALKKFGHMEDYNSNGVIDLTEGEFRYWGPVVTGEQKANFSFYKTGGTINKETTFFEQTFEKSPEISSLVISYNQKKDYYKELFDTTGNTVWSSFKDEPVNTYSLIGTSDISSVALYTAYMTIDPVSGMPSDMAAPVYTGTLNITVQNAVLPAGVEKFYVFTANSIVQEINIYNPASDYRFLSNGVFSDIAVLPSAQWTDYKYYCIGTEAELPGTKVYYIDYFLNGTGAFVEVAGAAVVKIQ